MSATEIFMFCQFIVGMCELFLIIYYNNKKK